jgi:hypothetical protein
VCVAASGCPKTGRFTTIRAMISAHHQFTRTAG